MTREEFVKDLIKKRGKNLKEFAAEIDMPYTTLMSILKGGFKKKNDDEDAKGGLGGASIDNAQKICRGLDISLNTLQTGNFQDNIILSKREKNLIYAYREHENMRSAVDRLLGIEIRPVNRYNFGGSERKTYFVIPYYTTSVSAGTGIFLDDESYETLQLEKEPPVGADFVLRVSGDSMEPTFYNGDKVFVSSRQSASVGDIGIFVVNGESYIKEIGINELISHNKAYSNIKFDEYTEVRCLGKVLGVCDE